MPPVIRGGWKEIQLLNQIYGTPVQPYNYEVGSSDCEGSDWKDFPNKVVELSDGKMCKKLHYFYEDNMSVPLYCEGKCNPKDNQKNILVLWGLPYTTNRQKTVPNSTAGWTRTVFSP